MRFLIILLQSIIFCDTAHYFNEENVKVVVVSKGVDAVDFAILNDDNKLLYLIEYQGKQHYHSSR